ncbi:hypothetical protein [Nostoc sp. FACHB-110]|uniref:hypothetical protein n=1 Tax=Nostoc sp. FACHB-110 TaxID=2692834 RepID=UPI0016852916|nr:hypothetical protein [Nostoc sp. FACHB-110]MBD2439287.1 hypothetical protein [Nostoc sp. FACHB-110]
MRKGEQHETLSNTQRVLEIGKSRSGCTGKHLINLDTDDYSWKHQGSFGEPDNTPKSLKDKLLGFLEDQAGREYTLEQLGTTFSSNKETVRRNLEQLRTKGLIERKEKKMHTKGGMQNVIFYFAPNTLTSVEPCSEMQP